MFTKSVSRMSETEVIHYHSDYWVQSLRGTGGCEKIDFQPLREFGVEKSCSRMRPLRCRHTFGFKNKIAKTPQNQFLHIFQTNTTPPKILHLSEMTTVLLPKQSRLDAKSLFWGSAMNSGIFGKEGKEGEKRHRDPG